ncbi:protein FAM219B isoform 3-T3 [Rhinophrynus dorsalis]
MDPGAGGAAEELRATADDSGVEGRLMETKGPSVEKKGPYLMGKGPTIQARLQRQRDLARATLKKKGMLGPSGKGKAAPKSRSVKFNKGYAALSQASDETLVSLDSDSDAELESRCSSGYSSAEVSQDLNRQLLQDGYHLDEIPDDEDLDLIPPKPVRSVSCPCCLGESWTCCVQ